MLIRGFYKFIDLKIITHRLLRKALYWIWVICFYRKTAYLARSITILLVARVARNRNTSVNFLLSFPSPLPSFSLSQNKSEPLLSMYGIRSHVQLTHDHHNLLHSVLKTDPYPTKEVKQALSDQIGVSYKQIDQWFRNRRRKSYIKQCMEKSLLCESVEKSFPAS